MTEQSPQSGTTRTTASSDAGATISERPLQRFFMTSDLRAATGLTRTHLDFYLREHIIIPTARTESGYLLFDEHELATLHQVIDWRNSGVSIRTIRARLDRHGDTEISDD
jgi:DNA-binding transcriptional MerR regulator